MTTSAIGIGVSEIPEVITSPVGLEYLLGPDKILFNDRVAAIAMPITRVGAGITELVIHGKLSPDNHYYDYRHPYMIHKIRTMYEPKDGEKRDVKSNSDRIMGMRANLARILGLDEFPQIDTLLAHGEVSAVGHRLLQTVDQDEVCFNASKGGVSDEEIDEWRWLQANLKPGLLGIAQAKRRLPGFALGTIPGDVMTVEEDLKYKNTATYLGEPLVMAKTARIVGYAACIQLGSAVTKRLPKRQLVSND